MSTFAKTLADRVEGYIALRRSLGYAFKKSGRDIAGVGAICGGRTA